MGGRFALFSQLHREVSSLLLDPRAIRLAGHSGDSNPSYANVEEKEDAVVHLSEPRDATEVEKPHSFPAPSRRLFPNPPRERLIMGNEEQFMDRAQATKSALSAGVVWRAGCIYLILRGVQPDVETD